MSTQEVYEHIRAYFSRPGAQLARNEDHCFYRTDDGRACAFGCLIPDDLYDRTPTEAMLKAATWFGENKPSSLGELIESRDASHALGVLRRTSAGKRLFPVALSEEFVLDAQEAHDGSESVPEFLRGLDNVAYEHGLTVAV